MAMRRVGVTQGQVAEACGVSGPALNQWLTGKTKNIDRRHLAGVAACTGTSVAWLTTGRGAPGKGASDILSAAQKSLLQDFRKLPPKVRAEVGRLVRAIAGL
jgi:transcriptional regulator with XRE-family HTH domain